MDRFTESLLIIIVIYNRALEACESFQSVLEMRKENSELDVFVYDNSSFAQTVRKYKGLRIYHFHDPENSGVSKAYNKGVAAAKENRKEWALLLDQDTILPNSILKNYCEAIIENPNLHLFVPILKLKNGKIFSPFRYRFKRGFYLDSVKPGKHSFQKTAPVNSGIMVRVKTFLQVGGYNEKVKLDFSDFQFIERFLKYHNDFYVLGAECLQDFSDDQVSLSSQANRFRYYCEGAKNIEKNGIWDWLQYNAVVFLRALRLGLRYKDFRFMTTYFATFLFPSESKV